MVGRGGMLEEKMGFLFLPSPSSLSPAGSWSARALRASWTGSSGVWHETSPKVLKLLEVVRRRGELSLSIWASRGPRCARLPGELPGRTGTCCRGMFQSQNILKCVGEKTENEESDKQVTAAL